MDVTFLAHIFRLLVFITPIYAANITPVFAAKAKFMEFLNKPIDFNIKLKGKPLFGSHKTIRGYVVGIFSGTFLAVYLNYFTNFWTPEQALLLGFLLSLGSLLGDTIKSFFKRRIDIAPGEDWIPFDQLDYSIGSLALSSIVIIWAWYDYLFMVGVSLLLHVVANGIKKMIWKK
jgi:CDP-2,3-bis-(O-geranylgeranyl)-sn-glycerol synthase